MCRYLVSCAVRCDVMWIDVMEWDGMGLNMLRWTLYCWTSQLQRFTNYSLTSPATPSLMPQVPSSFLLAIVDVDPLRGLPPLPAHTKPRDGGKNAQKTDAISRSIEVPIITMADMAQVRTALYWTALYCTVLYCTVLYCTVLCRTSYHITLIAYHIILGSALNDSYSLLPSSWLCHQNWYHRGTAWYDIVQTMHSL